MLRFDGVFLQDIWRIESRLTAHGAADIPQRIGEILDAQGLLTEHPMIGREFPGKQRELFSGRESRGYVALKRYDMVDDDVIFWICGFVDLWICGFVDLWTCGSSGNSDLTNGENDDGRLSSPI